MKFVRRIFPYALLVIILSAGVIFWFKHNEVLDWAAARGYQPSPVMLQLVGETTMTPYAERLFYANRPVVATKAEFNQNCKDPSEQVAVLGCFTGNRLGIYIYDVTDSRLHGIEHVTAAHEMLHQAYQRLGKQEKTRIGGLLQEYHDLTASRSLKDKIATYKHAGQEQLQNEMHSIFGTEADDLPVELEEYYRLYFKDRQKILALYKKYQSEFDKRISKIKDYDVRLENLKSGIETNKQKLQAREAELRIRRAQLDAYLAANQIEQYNAAVPAFNNLVDSYRSLINTTNGMVNQFNRLLDERNELAVQERELEDAIDSSIDAAPRH